MDDSRIYTWRIRDRFLNRAEELRRLEEWWGGEDQNALALYGRRRVGKSWLFRAFAHGKPALILVAERRASGAQLARFADQLEEAFGVRLDIPDLPSLLRALYRLAGDKTLVVIDEFPYLLPTRRKDQEEVLTGVQAVMEEERDEAELKLVLCGSHIAQMRGLLAEGSPIRGRVTPLRVLSLRFGQSQGFLAGSPVERIERFSVSGGMAAYLAELGSGGRLPERIARCVLSHGGPLFNDPREVLEEEFTRPGTYFSLLEELAAGERGIGDLAAALRTRGSSLTQYLDDLVEMDLVDRVVPVGGKRREARFRLRDPFLRFWFRFVFGAQGDLESGLPPAAHYANAIKPALPGHTAPVFEDLCREYVRLVEGIQVGSWWGRALDELRRDGTRFTDEIDVVGVSRGSVQIVGECKWTSSKMPYTALRDLEELKLPALRQDGAKLAKRMRIVLFAKTGFSKSLIDAVRARDDLELIDAAALYDGLCS